MVDMDKFSNLPKDITESILTRMPLKDAVRTSILSKGWRHKWTSIPSLVFTMDCCPASWKDMEPAIFTPIMLREWRHKLTSIINHVLSLHTGPVIQVDVASVPLWVRIYGLASRFWTLENLSGIASYIGTPMYMDPVTDGRKRNVYARVFVEINLAAPVTRKVPIQFSDGDTIEVNFLVENEPKFCPTCCSFGHDAKDCQFDKKKSVMGTKGRLKNVQVIEKQPTSAKGPCEEAGKATQQVSPTVHMEVNSSDNVLNHTSTTEHNAQHTVDHEETVSTKNNHEKKVEFETSARLAGKSDGITELQIYDKRDDSPTPQGTARGITLSNSFNVLATYESTTDEMDMII